MRIFISHNSKDKPKAERLAAFLHSQGIDTWFDKWDILAGDSIIDKLEDGLDSVDAFIILLSPSAVVSKWVREELRVALTRRLKKGAFRIIPLLLRNCRIPAFLRDYHYIRWERPSAAAKLKLLHALNRIPSATRIHGGSEAPFAFSFVSHSVSLSGRKGSSAKFTEIYRGVALKRTKRFHKNIFFDGCLSAVSCHGMSLSPHYS